MNSRMPLWFRAAVAGLFVVLLVPYVLVHGGGPGAAFARSAVGGFARRPRAASPDLALLAAARRPDDGSYLLNGMPVRFHTVAVPASAADAIARFERAFREAGYVTHRTTAGGSAMLVGLHPKTSMMLSVRASVDRAGRTAVRLAEQDLSKLDPNFRAEIPGMPVYPGATRKILVEPLRGAGARSLTYTASGSPDSAARFYLAEMRARGWDRVVAPASPPIGDFATLFFRRDGEECSIVIMPSTESGGAIVLATVGAGGLA